MVAGLIEVESFPAGNKYVAGCGLRDAGSNYKSCRLPVAGFIVVETFPAGNKYVAGFGLKLQKLQVANCRFY